MLGKIKRKLGIFKRASFGWFRHQLNDWPLPGRAGIYEIGRSVQGRPIELCRFGRGKPRIAFVACIHGNEVGGYRFLRRLLAYLFFHPIFRRHFTFFFLPCLNPDGYSLAMMQPDFLNGGRIGRFNANHVDLNRNFPVKSWSRKGTWSHGRDYGNQTEVYGGEGPGSEPETQALIQFLINQKIDLLFMFHNRGADVVGSTDPQGQHLARIFGQASGFKLYDQKMWEGLGQLGSCKEWCEGVGISMLEVEGSYRWGSDWRRQKRGLVACLKSLV